MINKEKYLLLFTDGSKEIIQLTKYELPLAIHNQPKKVAGVRKINSGFTTAARKAS